MVNQSSSKNLVNVPSLNKSFAQMILQLLHWLLASEYYPPRIIAKWNVCICCNCDNGCVFLIEDHRISVQIYCCLEHLWAVGYSPSPVGFLKTEAYFGVIPSWGLRLRHIKNNWLVKIETHDICRPRLISCSFQTGFFFKTEKIKLTGHPWAEVI